MTAAISAQRLIASPGGRLFGERTRTVGKHFAVALAVIAVVAIGHANAATLSLDCNGTVHVWINLDKSTISIWADGSNNGIDTYPAQITPTTIQWGPAKNHTMAYDDQGSLDRTTGAFYETMGPNGSWGHRGPLTCVKGTTPLPATKF